MAYNPKSFVRLFSLLLAAAAAGGPAAGQKQADTPPLLAGVKEALKKAGADGAAGKNSNAKLPYEEAQLAAILCAAQDYIAQPVSRALKAKLQFKPRYRDAADYTKTIRRPAGSDSRHHRLGDETVTVEVKQSEDKKTIEGYDITCGDKEALREISTACFLLQQALKDSPLDSQSARHMCPALKNLHTLLEYLPRYGNRYLELEAVPPRLFEVRQGEIETKRKELLQVQADWLAEMAAWRRVDQKSRKAGQ